MKNFWQRIRARLIQWLAGRDVSVITNVIAVGVWYPRGTYMVVSSNFIMGNFTIETDPEKREDVHDQVDV